MFVLTHWGRGMHICVSNLTTIGSVNGLSPGRRQAIIWTNAEILLIGPLGTNFSEILIEIPTFSFKKMCLKVSSAKWRPFCLSLNVLIILVLELEAKSANTLPTDALSPCGTKSSAAHGIDCVRGRGSCFAWGLIECAHDTPLFKKWCNILVFS